MITREAVLAKARQALGTKFRHQGRTLRSGLDCIGLLIWTLRELGVSDYDYLHYAAQPEEADTMSQELCQLLEPIALAHVQPGDILRFNLAGLPLHVGFATEGGVIHAASVYDKVVEHRLDAKWSRRIVEAYRIPGII